MPSQWRQKCYFFRKITKIAQRPGTFPPDSCSYVCKMQANFSFGLNSHHPSSKILITCLSMNDFFEHILTVRVNQVAVKLKTFPEVLFLQKVTCAKHPAQYKSDPA